MSSMVTSSGLAGFFTGLVLYLFLLWILFQRPDKGRLEWALTALVASLLVWFAGNLVSLLLEQAAPQKVARVLGVVNVVSFSSLALLPGLLLHTHWLYYRENYRPRVWERRVAGALLALLYGVLVALPLAVRPLYPASAVPPIQKLGAFQLPFLAMLALSYYGSGLLQLRICSAPRARSNTPFSASFFPSFFSFPSSTSMSSAGGAGALRWAPISACWRGWWRFFPAFWSSTTSFSTSFWRSSFPAESRPFS